MNYLEAKRVRKYYHELRPMSNSLQELRDLMTPMQRAKIDQDFYDGIKDNTPIEIKTDDSWLEEQLLKELVTTEHGIKYINSEITLNQYLNEERR